MIMEETMRKYNPQDFISALQKRTNNRSVPACPFCGGRKYTSTDSMASILIGTDLDSVSIGPTVPSGMLICQQCGHVEFFALGALGLLHEKDGVNDGKNESK